MYTLYYSPFACSIVPHIVLHRLGAPFKLEKVDIQSGQQFDDAYLKINQHAQVPTLDINGYALTQTGAILMYLAEQNPKAGLLPEDANEKAEVMKWLFYFTSSVHRVFNTAFFPERVTSGEPKEVYMKCLENIDVLLKQFEQQLQTQDFVCGSTLQLPDYYLFAVLNWIKPLQKDLDRFPKLSEFKNRLMAYPEVQQAVSSEFQALKCA